MYLFVFVAAVGALYFASLAIRRPGLGSIAAAIVWVLYAAYEYFIANGVLCDANCNIRVDLILIWPLLLCASLLGIYSAGQWTRTGKIIGGISLFLFASMVAISLYIMFAETPAAERAAQAKSCGADSQNGSECAPAIPAADSKPEAR